MVGKESSNGIIKFIIKHNSRILIGSVFLLGIILRLLFIGSREIAYDDAFSFFLARQPLDTIVTGTVADTMPPLYYFLLHYWMKISQDIWFLRLLNVVINLLTAFFVYKLAKDLFNEKAAQIATLLFVISPFQIYHSQELRMYSILLLGQVGFIYSVLKISIFKSKNSKLWILLAIIFGMIAMYSHNLGFVGLISINLILLFYRQKNVIKKVVLIQFIVFIFSLPWFYYLPQQIEKVQNAFWTQPPNIIDVIQSLMTLFAFLPMSETSMAIVLFLLLQSLIMATIFVIRAKSNKLNMLVLLFFFSPIFLLIISYTFQPVFVPRIFILSAVWLFILLGKYFQETLALPIGKLSFFLFILICMISLPYFYKFNSFPRSEFRKLSNSLKLYELDNTAIVHDNKLSFFPTMFYHKQSNAYYLADVPDSPNDTLAERSQIALGFEATTQIDEFLQLDNLIFVVFQQTIEEYYDQGVDHPVIVEIEGEFGKDYRIESIGDIMVYYFENNEKN
jgi:4-amino-4-deoxy-L-arabinose transferase-like glycosyltransferase